LVHVRLLRALLLRASVLNFVPLPARCAREVCCSCAVGWRRRCADVLLPMMLLLQLLVLELLLLKMLLVCIPVVA